MFFVSVGGYFYVRVTLAVTATGRRALRDSMITVQSGLQKLLF